MVLVQPNVVLDEGYPVPLPFNTMYDEWDKTKAKYIGDLFQVTMDPQEKQILEEAAAATAAAAGGEEDPLRRPEGEHALLRPKDARVPRPDALGAASGAGARRAVPDRVLGDHGPARARFSRQQAAGPGRRRGPGGRGEARCPVATGEAPLRGLARLARARRRRRRQLFLDARRRRGRPGRPRREQRE